MDNRELRELVHIRHELRRFVSQGPVASLVGTPQAHASALLSQMSALAARDPITSQSVQPEVERWRMRLGLV